MPHGRLPWPVPAAACSTECSLSSRGHPVEGPGFLHEKGAFPPLTGPPVENVKVEVPPGSVPCPHRSARVCRGYSHFADHLLRYRRVRPNAWRIFPFSGGTFRTCPARRPVRYSPSWVERSLPLRVRRHTGVDHLRRRLRRRAAAFLKDPSEEPPYRMVFFVKTVSCP